MEVHQRIQLPPTPLQHGSAPKDNTAYYPLAVWWCTKKKNHCLLPPCRVALHKTIPLPPTTPLQCGRALKDYTAQYPLAVWQCTKGYHYLLPNCYLNPCGVAMYEKMPLPVWQGSRCLLPPCSVPVHKRITPPTTLLRCGGAAKDSTAHDPLAVWWCNKRYHCLLPPCSVAVHQGISRPTTPLHVVAHQTISLPTTPLQCGSAPRDTTAYYPVAKW